MSFLFDPLSDAELDAIDIMPEGVYDFSVSKAIRKTSKSGNPMCELRLTVWDNSGKSYNIFDYLVFSKIPLNIKKISRFCKAVGLEKEYQTGQIPSELENYAGTVQIGIQDGIFTLVAIAVENLVALTIVNAGQIRCAE